MKKIEMNNEINVNVRFAESRDIPKILDLLSQVLQIHANGRPDIFKYNITKYNETELEEILEDETRPVFVAEADGEVCGYVFGILQCPIGKSVLNPIKTLYIDDFCVDENCRGAKIGTKLFEYVKTFAKEKNCYNITLNVWSFNESAMKFYESLGMKPQREYKEFIL
ncbi:MAG: GNAT family N-acetyltransferase [Clostridia bacterium]|nr:GNAT family N-acetyltransferase [Clostridia bacterium]